MRSRRCRSSTVVFDFAFLALSFSLYPHDRSYAQPCRVSHTVLITLTAFCRCCLFLCSQSPLARLSPLLVVLLVTAVFRSCAPALTLPPYARAAQAHLVFLLSSAHGFPRSQPQLSAEPFCSLLLASFFLFLSFFLSFFFSLASFYVPLSSSLSPCCPFFTFPAWCDNKKKTNEGQGEHWKRGSEKRRASSRGRGKHMAEAELCMSSASSRKGSAQEAHASPGTTSKSLPFFPHMAVSACLHLRPSLHLVFSFSFFILSSVFLLPFGFLFLRNARPALITLLFSDARQTRLAFFSFAFPLRSPPQLPCSLVRLFECFNTDMS